MSKFLAPHFYEISTDALSGIAEMGIEFLVTHMPFDTWYGYEPRIECGPFSLTGPSNASNPVYYGGYITWGDYEFFNCVTEIRDDGGYEWFPEGGSAELNNTTIARGVRHLKRSLNSMVLSTLFTHELYLDMPDEDWRYILEQITQAINPYNPEYVSMDYAVQYIRARNNISITGVSFDANNIDITYTGQNDMDTKCYVFNESDDIITHTLVLLPQINSASSTISVMK